MERKRSIVKSECSDATIPTPCEKFNIRWNNYSSVVTSYFRKLLLDEQFVDVTLACEGKSFKCHRIVLMACSPYFEKILAENPYPHVVIYLKDIKIWEMQALVTFMYNGEVSLNQSRLQGLVKVAEALKIKGLAPEPEPLEGDEAEECDYSGGEVDSMMKDETDDGQDDSYLDADQHLQPKAGQIRMLKRKGMPALPKLVKMQKTESLPKLIPQSNGSSGSDSQHSFRSNTGGPTRKSVAGVIEQADNAIYEYERAEAEALYGEDFDGYEDEDYKDVEDDIEQVEECVDEDLEVNSVDTPSAESEGDDGSGISPGGKKLRIKYRKDVKDSAISALNSGASLRQCSEAFGIPRKTLSKWKTQEVRDLEDNYEIEDTTVRRTGQEGIDRAERLQKAMELAVSGTTVRQAAAHFEIPRTTLCAYMKRRGVAPKRNFLLSPAAALGVVQGFEGYKRKPVLKKYVDGNFGASHQEEHPEMPDVIIEEHDGEVD